MAVGAVLCVATLTGWQRDTQTIFPAVLQATVFYLIAAPPMLGCALGRFDRFKERSGLGADVTAVRLLGIERNDYPVDEQGELSRADLVLAAVKGGVF